MERSLGIDLGEARVGVAISDELGMLAHPLETIKVAQTSPAKRIAEIVDDRKIAHVIVGIAKNMDGSSGPAAEKARDFIAVLKESVGCPVIAWDERLSTVQARRGMREAGRSEKQQREVIDQAAAAVILQSWLDSRACV
ncbi:MAG: Holliday junction resolvase RuvX [Terrimicrobiaceae bacterium]